MASIPLESLIASGEGVLRAKRYTLAFGFLWFWDYALTFKDEVNYAWKGRKIWAFLLFLLVLTAAIPTMGFLWSVVIITPRISISIITIAVYWPGYPQNVCDKTAFLSILYFSFATLFAQTTLTLRLYAVTRKSKILTAAPLCISLAQFFFGCYVWVETRKLGSMHPPPIPIEAFQYCFFNQGQAQEVTLVSFSLAYDLLAFAIVVWESRRRGSLGRSDIPTILDNIVKDATVYFLVIFGSHLVAECCILFAPPTYRLLPANSSVVFVPIMSSRLMLSLKKAGARSVSFTCTEDPDAVLTEAMFADDYTTMEFAMEAGLSRELSRPDDRFGT